MKHSFFDSTLEIDLNKLKKNYLSLKNKAKNSICAATIKANAYGLGVEKILKTLISADCNDFFVANINEAISIRKLNKNINIYVFHGIKNNEAQAFLDYKITPVINSKEQLNISSKIAQLQNTPLDIILHFDTGMNRLGIEYNDYEYFYNYDYKMLNVKYIMSHLACASELVSNNNQQFDRFNKIIKYFPHSKYSLANSSAIFLDKKFHFDMVRAGVAIYGVNPSPYRNTNPMLNIIKLSAKIIDIKNISKDGFVGYGSDKAIAKNSKIAIIPIGYADGYARILSNKADCFINGNYYPIIGRISMDLTIIDISNDKANNINIGDDVELIGNNVKIDDISHKANTISYEILTSLKGRYNIKYIEN